MLSLSRDGSKYPFMLGFNIKDTADSGANVDKTADVCAPKKK